MLISSDNAVLMAAQRVTGGGRVVAFGKEAFVSACTNATLCAGPYGRLLMNSIAWAAGGNSSVVRLAVGSTMPGDATFYAAVQKAAVSLHDGCCGVPAPSLVHA